MKKRIFTYLAFGLLSMATAFSQVEINETNFPDANFRNYLLEQSFGSDGVITNDEIMDIVDIRVYFRNIADLTGIKYFSALKTLLCYYNQLTSLDVSGMTSLQDLDCSDNELTSLNMSGLVNLERLECSNNKLASLNVSDLVNLKTFGCGSNGLTSLDVSNLVNLESLDCYDNALTSLNVSSLVNLKHFYCYSNKLTSLDVSNLTNLAEFGCDSNELTSLDVANLKNLEEFVCSDNRLTSLDVSRMTMLYELCCNSNQLTSLDVSANKMLEYLYCDDNQLTSLDVSTLENLQDLVCDNQTPSLTLTGTGNYYSLVIALNNPTGFDSGISYENGKLISTSSSIETSFFEADVLGSSEKLNGTLMLKYSENTKVSKIVNNTRQAAGFYDLTGRKLEKEPKGGAYIVVYENGNTEKVVKKQ